MAGCCCSTHVHAEVHPGLLLCNRRAVHTFQIELSSDAKRWRSPQSKCFAKHTAPSHRITNHAAISLCCVVPTGQGVLLSLCISVQLSSKSCNINMVHNTAMHSHPHMYVKVHQCTPTGSHALLCPTAHHNHMQAAAQPTRSATERMMRAQAAYCCRSRCGMQRPKAHTKFRVM
jgi:hypothetical protein